MKPTFCSLAAVAAVVTTLVSPPATATRGAILPGFAAEEDHRSGEVRLALTVLPGRIEVELLDGEDRPVEAVDASGKAVLTVNGRSLGVALVHAGSNRLVGLAPFRDGDEVTVAVSVVVEGRTVTAGYGMR